MSELSEAFLEKQEGKMNRYYAFHAKIYDLTRWTFLFGRKELVDSLPFEPHQSFRLLEVGCGTGYNLLKIRQQYPYSILTGLDISQNMLDKAKEKLGKDADHINLVHAPYHSELGWEEPFDVIMFSYSLSMINPYWKDLIDVAYGDLAQGGIIAVSDFHNSRVKGFKQWMGVNHVRMDGHLLEYLEEQFYTSLKKVTPAYGNLWQYMMFLGRKS